MILISKKQLHSILLIGLIVSGVFLSGTTRSHAQSSQSLSVSPTLFEMAAARTQEWRSTIRVVNPNSYDLTVYVTVVNFEPRGEAGDGTLLPVFAEESDGHTLAEWIDYSREPIVIPAEKSYDVPFTVRIPEDATPGGHSAAFMVGTVPKTPSASTQVRTSQVVTSLFFLRVSGDVLESGTIREFSATKYFYQKPEAEFYIRFENKGNVHLRPQGDIRISNMWGQERGVIPINQQSQFGNVLPNSIRRFSFSWRGQWALADMGRYSAVATLAYGSDARNFVTSKTHFWIIPLFPLMIVLFTILTLTALIVLAVRRYVRRVLSQAGFTPRTYASSKSLAGKSNDLLVVSPLLVEEKNKEYGLGVRVFSVRTRSILAFCRTKIKAFRSAFIESVSRLPRRVRFGICGLGALFILILAGLYMRSALTPQRSYEVIYDHNNGEVSVVSSDQILFEEKNVVDNMFTDEVVSSSSMKITIVNKSGVAGAGAKVALKLTDLGYDVEKIITELSDEQGRTVIVYRPQATDIALKLSKNLENALLSAYGDDTSTSTPIVVYVGRDITDPE